MQYSVQPGRNTNNEAHAHLLGNALQLHEFHANPSQTFTPYNSQKRSFRNTIHFTQKDG